MQRLIALTRADLMLLFLLIFDMSTKPEWGDLSLWVAIAGFAMLAGILVRNGLNAKLARPPPSRSASPPSYSSSSTSELAAGDAVALGDVDGLHDGLVGRDDRRLHLHRLEHEQGLARLDAVARGRRAP